MDKLNKNSNKKFRVVNKNLFQCRQTCQRGYDTSESNFNSIITILAEERNHLRCQIRKGNVIRIT